MIQIKNRHYFINEKLVKEVFKRKDKFYVRLTTGEIQEVEEHTYLNLGGEI